MAKITHQTALPVFFLLTRPRASFPADLSKRPPLQPQTTTISSDVAPRSSSAQPPELGHVPHAPPPQLWARHGDKTLGFLSITEDTAYFFFINKFFTALLPGTVKGEVSSPPSQKLKPWKRNKHHL